MDVFYGPFLAPSLSKYRRTAGKSTMSHFTVLWKNFILFVYLVQVAVSQDVVVTTEDWVDIQQRTVMTCAVTQIPAGTGLDQIQWLMNDLDAPDITGATLIYEYDAVLNIATPGATVDASRYEFVGSGDFPLTIKSTELVDEGKYWCSAVLLNTDENEDSSVLKIRVPPRDILIMYNNQPLTDNSIDLVARKDYTFTCSVSGIKPEASFQWALNEIPKGGGDESSTPIAGNLFNSSSTLTTTIPETPEVKLNCSATNKQVGLVYPDIEVVFVFAVEVPPKSVSMSDPSGALVQGDQASVNQSMPHTFTCDVQGTKPAATIEWYLGGVLQTAGTSSTSQDRQDGLIDTTSTWTFTPSRDDHSQEVKCVAKTANSEQPFPSVIITLLVNGPPDTPVIDHNTPLTENQATVLTCTANYGYPDDWSLMWSDGGTPVTGSPADPSASGDRYIFTSTLNFTPMRVDNGNTPDIMCSAKSPSLTQMPQGSLGTIDVQFCARSLSLVEGTDMLTCPYSVTAGTTVSFTCVSESSNPATTLTWFKDDVILTTPTDQPNSPGDYGGNKTTVTYTGTLTKNDNSDVYKCCATNSAISSCGTNLCEMCTLNVKYPPELSDPIQTPPGPVLEGTEVTLMSTVDANPLPQVFTWVKQDSTGDDDDVLTTSLSNDNRNSTLTLSNIKRGQSGNYTCRANNGVPTDDASSNVFSSPVTVVVNYEVNITNKAMDEIGGTDGEKADLTCIALGNPKPTMKWYSLNNTQITSDTDVDKFIIASQTTGGDWVYGYEVTSTLTIKSIYSDVDFGIYTCNSTNGIGNEDSLKIELTGTRRPDKPRNVRIPVSDRTANSLTVSWTPGYNGGAEQWFRIGYRKTSESVETLIDENITEGKVTYTVTGLDAYTQYDIRVYAQNIIGPNLDYGNVMGYTLPEPPGPDSGISVVYDPKSGKVDVTVSKSEDECIQLEVAYEDVDGWQECGECITADRNVILTDECPWSPTPPTRRRRAVGDVKSVRYRLCKEAERLCSAHVSADGPTSPLPITPDTTGIIAGGVVGGFVLLAIIAALAIYLLRTSPNNRSKQREDSGSSIELQRPVAHQEGNNGIQNDALENNDTYAQVEKKPPQRPEKPQNLPDVTYAEVNKNRKPPPAPPDEYAVTKSKKPKKYVPPSARAAEESAYEDVNIGNGDKPKMPPDDNPADTYANVGDQQDDSGRVVNEDGLIYAEVGHMKAHPPDQPPIQTEESTEYASLDFAHLTPKETS